MTNQDPRLTMRGKLLISFALLLVIGGAINAAFG